MVRGALHGFLTASMAAMLSACGLSPPVEKAPASFTPASREALILIGLVDAPERFKIRFNPDRGPAPGKAGAFQAYGVHFSTVAPGGFELDGESLDEAPLTYATLTVPPGRYVMTEVEAHDGLLDDGVTLDLCMGTIAFAAPAGFVTYVGDFTIKRSGQDGRTSSGVQFLDANFNAARAYLESRPGVIAELRKADLDKTVFLPPGRRDGPCVRRFFGG